MMLIFKMLIGLAVVILGCSNSTGPKNVQNKPLAAASVGISGGSVATGDVALMVPQGAFSEERKLQVFTAAEQTTSPEQVTKNFEISGLPQQFTQPLHLRLKYSGTLSGKNYIIVGGSYFFSGPGKDKSIYSYLPASDSTGYLVADLPPMTAYSIAGKRFDSISFPDNIVFFVMGLTGHDGVQTELGHFSLKFPFSLKSSALQLGKTLEDIYAFYQSEGYDFKVQKEYFSVDNIEVCISQSYEQQNEKVEILTNFSDDDSYRFKMFINQSDFKSLAPDAVKSVFGSAFLGFLQKAALPRDYVIKDNYLVYDGCVVWAEQMFLNDKTSVPERFRGNEGAPFAGLSSSSSNDWSKDYQKVRGYCCGMAALFEYLCDESRYGRKLIPKILTEFRNGTKTSVQAIANAAGESFDVWWPAFIKEYVSGKVYGVSFSLILQNVKETWTIRSKADSLQVFTDDYPGLSAKLFRIDLKYADIDSSSSLTFTVNKTMSEVQIYTVKNGILEFQGKGNELMLTKIRDLTRSGYSLLAVVTNSAVYNNFLETTPVTLTVEMKKPRLVQLGGYDRCIVQLDYLNCLFSSGNEWDIRSFNWGELRGSFIGYTFNAYSDTTVLAVRGDASWRYTTTVKIDLDVTLTKAIYFSAVYTEVFSGPSTKAVSTYELTGAGVPFKNADPYSNSLIYSVYGTDAKNYVKDISYSTQVNNFDPNVVKQFVFNDNTSLFINIWNSRLTF